MVPKITAHHNIDPQNNGPSQYPNLQLLRGHNSYIYTALNK